MSWKTAIVSVLALPAALMVYASALAAGPPKMPYVFEKYCFSCHQEHVQTGPIGILDMKTRAGNRLHPEYIRSNARFGYNAMPSFRPSEISDKGLDEIVAYLTHLAAYRETHPGYKPAPERRGK